MIGVLLAPAAAHAATITVDSTADSLTGCTLRNAITAANLNSAQGTCVAGQAGPTVDTISFAVPSASTITLTSALPAISDDVDISGPGRSQLSVSGADAFRVFKVNSGKTASMSGITITHGLCDSACFSEGGGILNSGTLTLQGVAVTNNTTSDLAGTSFPEGGGIFNDNGATLNLVLSTVTGNTVTATAAASQNSSSGGGLINFGTLTIDRSTVSTNNSTASGGAFTTANGGGIENDGALTITRSTVSDNTSAASGATTSNGAFDAGIGNYNDPVVDVTIDRTTVSRNTASASGAGSESSAGGIDASGDAVTLTSSTIAHNTANSGNLDPSVNTLVKNTIVSNPGGPDNCPGPGGVTSQGFNLIDSAGCGFTDPTDQTNTDPLLAASLASNGGPTQTYALQSGSPAIDQGKSSIGETVDQRGQKRPSDFGAIPNATGGDGSDIGAFELQDTTPPNTIIDSGPSGVTNDPTPTFAFHSTEAGSSLKCKLDAGGAYGFAPCSSPKTIGHLADGMHTFQVQATDAAGNSDPTPASRSFTLKTAEVKRSGSTLMITAAPGAKDNLQITRPSATTLRVTDSPGGAYTGSGVHTVAGTGCSRTGDYTANCSSSGITMINVASGAGTDRVINATTLPSSINGGAAADVLIGGSADDTITGGPGADSMKGRNGNDRLLAHDLTSDAAINCDGGTKPGTADHADLDLLPADPDSIVVGCETKTRH